MDVLSDVLRVIRLNGSLFLNGEFGEPWCVRAPAGGELAREMALPHEHMAICHLVLEGRCWARLDGEAVSLDAGDVVVLPHGHAHVIGSGLRHGPVSERDAVAVPVPEMTGRRFGGRGAPTRVVCGWFAYERHVAGAVMSALPPIFRTRISDRPSGAWLEGSIRYAVEEAVSRRPGSGYESEAAFNRAFKRQYGTTPGAWRRRTIAA